MKGSFSIALWSVSSLVAFVLSLALIANYGTNPPVRLPLLSIAGYAVNTHYVLVLIFVWGVLCALNLWKRMDDSRRLLGTKSFDLFRISALCFIFLAVVQSVSLVLWAPSVVTLRNINESQCRVAAIYTVGVTGEAWGKFLTISTHSVIASDTEYSWTAKSLTTSELEEWKVDWEGRRGRMILPAKVSLESLVPSPSEIVCAD